MQKVADHSGHIKNKSFEMTIPQFQNFHRQFKEIAAITETVWKLITWLRKYHHPSENQGLHFLQQNNIFAFPLLNNKRIKQTGIR